MLNLDLFHNHDLPYVELPTNARNAALNSVSRRGFTPLEHFNLFSLRENHPLKTNILSFAHPVHRTPEYTGLTVFNAVDGYNDREIVAYLARSAAPCHLIHRNNEFSFWVSPIQGNAPDPRLIETHIPYDQLDNALSRYDIDLMPQRIIDVKQGRDTFTTEAFRDIQPLQWSLWAAEVTGVQLVNHFAATVSLLRELLRKTNQLQEQEINRLTTTISIQLLGAIILADTGVLGEDLRLQRPTLDKLIRKASKSFGRYFKRDLFLEYSSAVEEAYDLLKRICYATFVPDMLKELYGAAFSRKERKESGSYDTPLYLTRRIWENIPVEFLSTQQRVVADMTCGWGSFLVAGYERLSSLKDMEGIALREHLYGNDSTDFTAQLAGLGLLLSTSEDKWNIDSYDALQWPWLQTNQPGIIVGNPPFGGDRKRNSDDALSPSERRRFEKANLFIEQAIKRLAPRGYLAMIMPSSFIASEASPTYRKLLLDYCDVLDIWDIPSGVFDATVQTVVLFAQKRDDSTESENKHHPVRVRTIQPYTFDITRNAHIYTASELVADQTKWNEQSRKSKGSHNTYIMDYKLVLPEYIWQTIRASCIDLCELAEVFRGVTVGRKPEKKRWRNYPNPKPILLLNDIRHAMPSNRQWSLDYTQATRFIYPNEFKEPCKNNNPAKDKEHLLDGVKVLVPYDVNPTWGKRIRVAIEREGYYVSDHFYVVVPKSIAETRHITHEVIAAILNWDVSNAWVIEYLKSPSIPKRVIDTIPFPKDLSEIDCKYLTQAVLLLESTAYNYQSEPMEAIQTIDSILKKAYHLDDATFARLRQVKEWDSKRQITLDPLPYTDEADCFISGIVDSVNVEERTITLWMGGFDILQTVRIVPSMPGWMLRPNVAFRTTIPRRYFKLGAIDADTLAWGTFRPQPYTYMSEEELLERFASLPQ